MRLPEPLGGVGGLQISLQKSKYVDFQAYSICLSVGPDTDTATLKKDAASAIVMWLQTVSYATSTEHKSDY